MQRKMKNVGRGWDDIRMKEQTTIKHFVNENSTSRYGSIKQGSWEKTLAVIIRSSLFLKAFLTK